MGTSAAQTVTEIEDTRDRLEAGMRELESRLPKPAVWTKRLIGVAVGGGLSGTMFWFGVRRIKNRREEKKQPQMQAVVQVLPDGVGERVADALENGEVRTWAIAVGGGWLLLRLLEIRQLRKMNRALLASR